MSSAAIWPTPESVARALGKAERNGKNWKAQCPAHDDKDPSLSIAAGQDGRLLVHCHGGCDQGRIVDVLRKRGLWGEFPAAPRKPTTNGSKRAGMSHTPAGDDWLPILPPPGNAPKPSDAQLRCDMLHEYYDADDHILCYVRRHEKKGDQRKQFIPLTFGVLNGIKGWHSRAPQAPKPLYRLNALSHAAPDAPVLLCEGEKAAEAAQRLFPEFIAMAWMGGAQAVQHADLSSLAGWPVILWPDADDPGRKAVAWLMGQLPAARTLNVDGLPDGFDAADLEQEGPDDPMAWLEARLQVPPQEDAPEAKPKDNSADFFPLLTDLDLEALPDPVYLIEDILVADTLFVLYGPWGSYKSFLALHLALCLATGTAFFGKPVVQSDVLYIAGEGVGGMKKRVAGWKKHHATKAIPGFRLVPVAVNLLDRAEAERLITTVVAAQRACGFSPKTTVVDTLHRSMPGADENAAKEMGVAISNGAHIQAQLGCALLPVHHTGKDIKLGMRGSYGLPAAADGIGQMTKDETSNHGTLLIEKQKDGEAGQKIQVRAEGVDLPPGADGKPRNSLVLVPDGETRAKPDKLTGVEKKAKQFLADLIVAEGRPLPTGSGFPTPVEGRPLLFVPRSRWHQECEARHLSTAETKKSRDFVFRRSFGGLMEKSHVASRDELVWIVS